MATASLPRYASHMTDLHQEGIANLRTQGGREEQEVLDEEAGQDEDVQLPLLPPAHSARDIHLFSGSCSLPLSLNDQLHTAEHR